MNTRIDKIKIEKCIKSLNMENLSGLLIAGMEKFDKKFEAETTKLQNDINKEKDSSKKSELEKILNAKLIKKPTDRLAFIKRFSKGRFDELYNQFIFNLQSS